MTRAPTPARRRMRASIIAALVVATALAKAHDHDMGPINPVLGTHGYPDCVPGPEGISDDLERNQMTMRCAQRGAAGALKIACVRRGGGRCA